MLFLTYILNDCFSQILSLHTAFLQELVTAYCFIVPILTITTFFYCFHSFLRSFGIGIEVAATALFVLTFIRIFSSKTLSESTVLCFNAFFDILSPPFYFAKLAQTVLARAHILFTSIFFQTFWVQLLLIKNSQSPGGKIILGISCRAHLLSVCLSLARKISSNN